MRERLGVLGPKGTHSEAAARYLQEKFRPGTVLIFFDSIVEALHAVETKGVRRVLVPVENSLEGAVNVTLDTLAESDELIVTRELVWPIHNMLMARSGNIGRIYSHAQPIAQCRGFLARNFPAAELITVASTARAAEIAGSETGAAAICTERAGKMNGLDVIAADIADTKNNRTRFFEVSRADDANAQTEKADTVLIICQIDGKKAGSLLDVLAEFAERGVNLTRIESRPARTNLGDYIFFFDLETNVSKEATNAAIEAVRKKSSWLKQLGAFPVVTVNVE